MPEMLWTSQEIAAATGGEALGEPFAVSGLSIDTRTLQPGDLFVALTGARDGHDYLAAAFKAGATGALVSKLSSPVIPDGAADPGPSKSDVSGVKLGSGSPLRSGRDDATEWFSAIKVDDTLKALERLAAAARDRSPARRCAVTGSVGKTSVTQAIAAALRIAGRSHAPVKSFNNHIGVPLTLAALPRDAEYAVFELGMNHAGEIGALSRLVRPHAAVVTTVGPVHTENFADGEAGVARAKAEIFEGLEPGGVAILNADDRWFETLADAARAAGARLLSFGSAEACDAQLLSSLPLEGGGIEGGGARADVPEAGAGGGAASTATSSASVRSPPSPPFPLRGGREIVGRLHGRLFRFPIAQSGAHWGPNGLAVLLAVEALGAPVSAALQALAGFKPLAGRGATRSIPVPGGEVTLIDESYNANPVSMRAAIATLAQSPGRRIAVLTDMLELGSDAGRHHAELAGPLATADVAATYLAGPSMRHLHDALPHGRRGVWAGSAAELAPAVLAALRPGDTVMVKGSHGSQAGFIIQALLQASAVPAGADA